MGLAGLRRFRFATLSRSVGRLRRFCEASLIENGASESIELSRIQDLAALNRRQGAVQIEVDGCVYEMHGAIGESELQPTGMAAAERVVVVPVIRIEWLAVGLHGIGRNGASAVTITLA